MIRIVIADDHTIMREGLKRILDGAPDIDIVGEAIDGFEVLGHVRQGGFDLLLLDLSMPGRSGVDLIRQIKAEAPKLAILILTMHEEEQYAVRAIRAGAQTQMSHLRMVVVDEWHELIGNKRGVQLQLALARLRRWNPALIVWGVSATLGNQAQAQQVLLPQGDGVSVEGKVIKDLHIDTLLPPTLERFPWAGHIGLRMLPSVVAEVESSSSCLIFTNTRAQSELWYQALLDARPDWAGLIALHHGSLAREVRDWVERSLKDGRLKAVVCTSSLDLGVDFLPVERVLQIGSVKGIARLMQRAGRSGHAPGRASRITLVPTHSLELVEAAAAKAAVAARMIEPRESPRNSLDVLVQHLVSMALAGGFRPDELLSEVRSTWAYQDLSDEQWRWALALSATGVTP